MIPCVMGVVMALFVMSSGMHAAEAQSKTQSSLRFYASVPEVLTEAEHLPTPEEDAFAKLKENALKRAALKQGINEQIAAPECSVKECERMLAQEEALLNQTEQLAMAYKDAADLKSPQYSDQSEKIVQQKDKWQAHLTDMRMVLADNEDTLNKCKRKKSGFEMQMGMYSARAAKAQKSELAILNVTLKKLNADIGLVEQEVQESMRILAKLFAQVHAVRMAIAKLWYFDFDMLSEADVASYHVEAFKYYMRFEQDYHELEKNILKQF